MVEGEVERELLALEERYWRAMMRRDYADALRLSDDPCIITGAQGVATIDKGALASLLELSAYTLRSFEVTAAQVRLLRDDVAVVAYTVREELTVDGEPITLDAADSSVWVRREGRWLCAAHSESVAGDPFGRDRRPNGSSRHYA